LREKKKFEQQVDKEISHVQGPDVKKKQEKNGIFIVKGKDPLYYDYKSLYMFSDKLRFRQIVV
jgi:hypothetical protein